MKLDNSFTNMFLIATPSLEDPLFSRAVVYLFDEGEEGVMGLIINQALDIKLNKLLKHMRLTCLHEELNQHPVLMGGPVSQNNGFLLYKEISSQGREEIIVSPSQETLRSIIQSDYPPNFIMTLGCAAWGPGQLETEIARGDWLLAPYSEDVLFTLPLHQRWHAAGKLLGVDIYQMSGQTGHA